MFTQRRNGVKTEREKCPLHNYANNMHFVQISVADPERFDADPDPTFKADADPDPAPDPNPSG